jgi:ABC-type glycerol-3-phosphate transport system permease component
MAASVGVGAAADLGAAVVRRRRERGKGILAGVARYTLATAYLIFVMAPIVYMFLIALHSSATAGGSSVIPSSWHWQTFVEMWRTVDLALYLRNSLIIATLTGLASSLLALGAGYVVGRFRFRYRNLFRISLLATHVIPGVLVLLPLFVMFIVVQQLAHVVIVGSFFSVVLTDMTFALPLAIWLLSIYIASLPAELEEAAMTDGASRFQVLRRIVLPLSLPGLVVTFIFSFLHAWNEVLFASVLTSPETRTIGVGLQYYLSENYAFPQWNQLMGASLVSALPAVLLFLPVQRYIVRGLTGGSLKS